jgi:uncharacterized phiE125 gp8 family phage protein
MSIKIIVPPDEIITVDEAAEFMRIDFPDDETETIEAMITAARIWCEDYLRRAIGIQTVELLLPGFPRYGKRAIILRPPLIEVEFVKYLDSSGVEQTMDEDDYRVSLDSIPGEIRPVSAWPNALDTADSVRIRFQTGYYAGGSPELSVEIPKTIKHAMLMQIADLYQNREAQSEKILSVNPTLERMISMYRLELGI